MSEIQKGRETKTPPPPIPPNPHKSNESIQINTAKDLTIPPKPRPRNVTLHTD
jgi:hypothetical protein